MANTKSAKKATRVTARRTEINKDRTSRIRTFVRKVEEAIASGNPAAAAEALKAAQPELMLNPAVTSAVKPAKKAPVKKAATRTKVAAAAPRKRVAKKA